jgi:serine/threonine protein kinase
MPNIQPLVKEYGIKLLTLLAETRMSEVWLAEQEHATLGQQLVVVKLAQAETLSFSRTSRQAILNEERWLKRFQIVHPVNSDIVNILPITYIREKPIYRAKIFHPKESWFLLLEYLKGGSLSDLLREQLPLSVVHALRIAYDLARTLDYIHQLGCVHLDIKPSNIMFRDRLTKQNSSKSKPVIIDFGISHTIGTNQYVSGAEGWLAPEVLAAKNAKKMINIHPSMDIFPFGLLIDFMLTGQHPTGQPVNVDSIKTNGTFDERNENALIDSMILEEINGLVLSMTSIDPSQRPSAGEVAEELGKCLANFGSTSTKKTVKNFLLDSLIPK